ncbi:MAG: excinuclease ABC subunit UvrC [Candidatus Margulisiibacteriota bacterium]
MISLEEKLKQLPNKPGVYFFKDRIGTVIYIGKAKSLRKRVSSYFKPNLDIKTSILISRIRDIDFILTASELDALTLENDLIKKYMPRYNILLRDDKNYPYLKLTKEQWPRLLISRRKEKDGAIYFGRFQGAMVKEIIRLVKKLFPIRWCKESPLRKREQPCLFYRIGACSGPCAGNITPTEYKQYVKGIVLLIRGKLTPALKELNLEMKRASDKQDYEKAAYFRDRIKKLEKMIEGRESLINAPGIQSHENLEAIKTALKMEELPQRIECFDISNIQGSNIVASMVVFVGGTPLKAEYRKFNIYGLHGKPNDVMAIYEVIKRRYGGALSKELSYPDLVMVDGGAGQVSAAKKALEETGYKPKTLIGLAKKEETIYFSDERAPLLLPIQSLAIKLLQRIRNEAHRFAITFHRAKRLKGLFN